MITKFLDLIENIIFGARPLIIAIFLVIILPISLLIGFAAEKAVIVFRSAVGRPWSSARGLRDAY